MTSKPKDVRKSQEAFQKKVKAAERKAKRVTEGKSEPEPKMTGAQERKYQAELEARGQLKMSR